MVENVHSVVDETDLQLIHALQMAPRAPWNRLAPVLGLSAPAVAARWRRLRADGIAWMAVGPGHPEDGLCAFVEVSCDPASRAEVGRVLCDDPRAVTVDVVSPGAHLNVTVLTHTLGELNRFLLHDLPAIPGVEGQHHVLATAIHRQGASWRLDALDAEQQAEVAALADQPGPRETPTNHEPLVAGLARDARLTAAELALETGRNPATVRRQLARLLSSGELAIRCDVAHAAVGWPVCSTWLVRVPGAEHDHTASALSTLAGTRLCASVTGTANMMFTLYARSLADLTRLERVFAERLPWMEVRETYVHLAALKQMGWMFDTDGLATGELVAPAVLSRG